ncbi:MAG: hypothetical protein RMK62_11120, partial [Armatimonadota bacterium]|nr:hypothetical protein [Armatimonadota bacterium]
ANCYPPQFARLPRSVNYGFNEQQMNGPVRLSEIREAANLVILADNWNTFLTPWSRSRFYGINPRIAFANASDACWAAGGGWRGCPTTAVEDIFRAQGDDGLDRLTRHLGGAILTFADGHSKFYQWRRIRSRHRGGELAFDWREPNCRLGRGASDDGLPPHDDNI